MKSWLQDMIWKCIQNIMKENLTSISKNNHIDKLDDIINKYHNTYHSAIKMKPVDVKSSTCINFSVEKMIKILNLKLVTM